VNEPLFRIGGETHLAFGPWPGQGRLLAPHLTRVRACLDLHADLIERVDVVVRSATGRKIYPQHHHVLIAEYGPMIGRLLDRHWRVLDLRRRWQSRVNAQMISEPLDSRCIGCLPTAPYGKFKDRFF